MQNNQTIAIFGAGFLGRHLMRQLTKLGYRVKVATRNPNLKLYLKPLGNPGQIELFKTNIFNPEDVKKVLKNCDFAINLCGALFENRRQKFNQIHAQWPKLLGELCKEFRIKNLVSVSALGIKEKHPSKYIQSKLQGERNIQETFKTSVILRPSLIFGPEDKFFNTFASIAQFSPVIPLIGGGKTKFAPIYVGDVAKAIVKVLELNNSIVIRSEPMYGYDQKKKQIKKRHNNKISMTYIIITWDPQYQKVNSMHQINTKEDVRAKQTLHHIKLISN